MTQILSKKQWRCVWHTNYGYTENNPIFTVKCGGESLMFWGYFSPTNLFRIHIAALHKVTGSANWKYGCLETTVGLWLDLITGQRFRIYIQIHMKIIHWLQNQETTEFLVMTDWAEWVLTDSHKWFNSVFKETLQTDHCSTWCWCYWQVVYVYVDVFHQIRPTFSNE